MAELMPEIEHLLKGVIKTQREEIEKLTKALSVAGEDLYHIYMACQVIRSNEMANQSYFLQAKDYSLLGTVAEQALKNIKEIMENKNV